MRSFTLLLGASLAAAIATPAAAQTITGNLAFGSPANGNFFNPSTATIGNGVEFTYTDSANTDTADFTPTSLTIRDVTSQNAATFYMTFSTTTPGFFNNAAFTSNGFGGTISVVNNVLTFTAPEFLSTGTRTAVITFAGANGAVPEPATWAMMLMGFGAMGLGIRRQIRRSEVKFNARIKAIETGEIA